MLVAIPVAVKNYGAIATKEKRTVWASLGAYFISFFLIDFLVNGDFHVALRAIAPSSPVLAAAIIAMAIDRKHVFVSPRKVGEWCSIAVLITVGLACLILLMQPSWQILGRSITDISGVNGRLSLFVGNPLPFAGAFLTLGFISLLGWDERGAGSRVVGIAAMALAILIVVLWSQSRGATLAAIPLVGLAIWYMRPSRTVLLQGAALMVVVTVALISLFSDASIVSSALSRLSKGLSVLVGEGAGVDASTWQRLVMYRAGIAAWMESPIYGYGISQRFHAVLPYLPQDFGSRYTHLHNTFVTHAVAGGLIGIFFLLTLLLTPFATNRAGQASHHFEGRSCTRDSRYFAWLIFLSLVGIGMTGVILNQDVSANFL